MNDKKTIYVNSILMAFIFSVLYFLVFSYYIPSTKALESTLYVNQIGLFDVQENALSLQSKLQQSMDCYVYEDDNVYVVVSGITTSKEESELNASLLSEQGYAYLAKEYMISDQSIMQYIELNQIQQALELIANQN